jgi:hypothetical protein
MREFGEDDQLHVEERLVADDGAVDHPQQEGDPLGDLGAIPRAGQIGLARGRVVAGRIGHGTFDS